MSFSLCIDYNAKAVSFMGEGRHQEAFSALKVALQSLNETQAPSPATTAGAQQASPSVQTQAQEQTMMTDATRTRTTEGQAASTPSDIYSVPLLTGEEASSLSPDNIFAMYPRAFVIHPDRAANRISESRLLVVLLYNFAVLNHIRALQHQKPNGPTLQRHVLPFYKNCMQAIHTTWTHQDAEEMLVLTLAVTCNAGHAHSHLMDFPATKDSLSLLLRLATLTSARNTVPVDDFEVFFESVCIFLEGMDLSNAPAA